MPKRHWRPFERLVWGGTCDLAPGIARTWAGTAVSMRGASQGCMQGQLELRDIQKTREPQKGNPQMQHAHSAQILDCPLPCACAGKLQGAWESQQWEVKGTEATRTNAKHRSGARQTDWSPVTLTASQQKINPCLRKSTQSSASVMFHLQHPAHTQKSLLEQRNKKMWLTVKIQGCQWSR